MSNALTKIVPQSHRQAKMFCKTNIFINIPVLFMDREYKTWKIRLLLYVYIGMKFAFL